MASFENMQWTLIAQDEASGTLKKIALAAKEVGSASDSMAKSTEQATSSWQDTAKGVFAGAAAFEFAKQGLVMIKDLMMESVQAASDYQVEQAQLNAVLESTGHAAGLSAQELNDMADSIASATAIAGGEINKVQSILLTFTTVGKQNFEQVTKAALDYATMLNGGGVPSTEQLKTATIQLGKAMDDPIKGMAALKKSGVSLTDEQINLAQQLIDTNDNLGAQQVVLDALATQTAGSAAAAAKTYEGRMARLEEAITNVKEQAGLALMPTLALLTDEVIDSTGKVKLNDDQMRKWQIRIFEVVGGVKTIIQIMGGFAGVIVALGNVFIKTEQVILGWATDVVRGMMNVGDNVSKVFDAITKAAGGDFSGALDTLKSMAGDVFKYTGQQLGELGSAIGDVGGAISSGMANARAAIDTFAEQRGSIGQVAADMTNAGGAAAGFGENLTDLSGASEDAAGSQEKLAESVSKVSDDYTKAREDIAKELMDLEASHAENIGKIKANLESLQTTLEETTADYQKSMADLNTTEAEKVVEQEQKIADIKASIAEAIASAAQDTTGGMDNADEVKQLQAQLAQEEAAYGAYIETRTGLDAELAEARRRASETQFQRDIEDINAKRAEEQSAYDAKIAEIQGEVLAEQAALAEEQTVYEAKKAMYAEVDAAFQAFHDSYLGNMEGMRNYTSESVAVMTTELARISALFKEIQSLRSSAGLSGVDLGAASGATTGGGDTTQSSSVTTQVTNNITVQVSESSATAAEIVAEIQRQIELAAFASS